VFPSSIILEYSVLHELRHSGEFRYLLANKVKLLVSSISIR
jgi:hypothetical protein